LANFIREKIRTIQSLFFLNEFKDFIEEYKSEDKYTQIEILSKILANSNPEAVSCVLENLFTASEIAKRLGVSKNRVGRITNKLGLKGNLDYSRGFVMKVAEKKYTTVWYYNEKAVEKIQEYINNECGSEKVANG
jgi:DNA-binding MarR family transcriptional regulator